MTKAIVQHIAPVFSDNRGDITDVLEAEVHHTGLITFAKNAVRANHYHRLQTQYTYVLSGRLEQKTKSALDENDPVVIQILEPGDLATLPPNTIHAYKALEETTMLCLTTRERTSESYEDDTIRVPPL